MRRLIALPAVVAACMPMLAARPLGTYVEPRIGTAHSRTLAAGMFGKGTEELGQTLPAVLAPHGMNFWTPQTRDTERKCVAPYYYADSLLQGLRNSHWIVGGCTQDYGSVTLMPLGQELRTTPAARASRFSHDLEEAHPDHYSVRLPDEGLTAEMTATVRGALFRFTYDTDGTGHLVVNPNSDEAQGTVTVDTLNRRITASNPVHRIYQGKGEPAGFAGWFVLEWPDDLEVTSFGTYRGENVYPGENAIANAPQSGAYITFATHAGEPVVMRAASSFTGPEGALANLRAEIPGFDFDSARAALADTWERQLGRIGVEGGSEQDLVKLYSALYRTSFLPRVFSDCDGAYPAFAKGTPVMHAEPGHDYYEDFSMWDTYRAQHPLLNILDPQRSADMMQSLVLKAEQGGWLPIFPCWNSYTAAMIGDHCTVTLADAWLKGIRGFDIEKGYAAMRRNAFESPVDSADYRNGMGRRALGSYLRYGYIPVEDSVPDAYHKREQVSRTLEYAFDDFALSRLARALGHLVDASELERRAGNWRNVMNPADGYAAPRRADGTWVASDPFAFSPHITEGAPCHYTWYVPHDQEGLMQAMGGRTQYLARLDSMFTQRRYWHGNEPCHQIAWLYSPAGEPAKTRRRVQEIMETEYLAEPGGLSGNDDAGQMSAWYVFGALGFYPVCPATDRYALGAPAFDAVTVDTGNGRKFTIRNTDALPPGVMTLDGMPHPEPWLTHTQLTQGRELLIGNDNKDTTNP